MKKFKKVIPYICLIVGILLIFTEAQEGLSTSSWSLTELLVKGAGISLLILGAHLMNKMKSNPTV